jgi:hypothetical protein
MKIDADGDIPGLATPAGAFTLVGIVQQDDYLRPFSTRYDVAPRNRTDLGAAAGGPSLITIAEARADVDGTTGETPDDFIPDRLGQQVKIRGVVTSVDFRGASGTEIYIQDPTGGVDIFSTSINTTFNIGDNLQVVGTVAQFNGLTEITPPSASDITILPPGTLPPVNLEVVTLSQLANGGAGEAYEGKLIRINNVTLASPPATFAANTNYNITDSTGTVQMRIDSDTDIDGTAPPASPFSVIGVLGQFDSAPNPKDDGYQLFPRIRASDFLGAVATPANLTATAGTPQQAAINTAFATQLQASVTDSGSNPIQGIGVTFTAPSTGASGTFQNGTNVVSVATNASGIATATIFTANGITGVYNVVASTNSLTANFSLENTDTACPPTPPTTAVIDADDTVCAGSTGNSATASAAGATNFQWSIVNGSITSGQGTASITYTAGASGSVNLTVVPFNANGCQVATEGSETVAVSQLPTAELPSTVHACLGGGVEITADLTGTAPFTVHWSDGVVQSNLLTNQATRMIAVTGNLVLAINQISDASCTNSNPDEQVTIIADGLPVITDQTRHVTIASGNTTTLSITTPTPSVTVQWFQGSFGNTSNPVGTSSLTYTTPALTQTTHYWFRLSTTCGTVNSKPIFVSVTGH